MELRHLRYFLATAELEHFGKAARRLGIVQPALSRQIRELEEELGVALFERLPRGVRLSAAGQAFREDAAAVLARAAAAVERARDVGRGRAGLLRIGFVDTSMYHPVVPGLINRFRAAHPGIKMDLRQDPSVAQWELLRTRQIDAALLYHLPPERMLKVDSVELGAEEIHLAVPSRHPFARRSSVCMAELRDEALVWFPRSVSPPFNDVIFDACARHGFSPRIVQEVRTDHAIISLVAAGVGCTFCISSAVFSKPKAVEIIRVRDLGLRFRLSLCWLPDAANPALESFIKASAIPGKVPRVALGRKKAPV